MGLRPVSLETWAEIVFKEESKSSVNGGRAHPCLLTSATSSRWGRSFPGTAGEVTAQHPVPWGFYDQLW